MSFSSATLQSLTIVTTQKNDLESKEASSVREQLKVEAHSQLICRTYHTMSRESTMQFACVHSLIWNHWHAGSCHPTVHASPAAYTSAALVRMHLSTRSPPSGALAIMSSGTQSVLGTTPVAETTRSTP
eukprot:CAMPEP_0114312376 /NCGR_PEP_ID=MMETSP0059-20121206/20396_1 /TAXON_ID=36894 /ORGANISM="Pyramimonas parkeae, Strain CCMP726" /LENGTH=128 /DNA_ID=CAMNT_0001436755 /DNA_START=78 /DNA_END=464 /DNA_ORIENTATION=+